MGEKELKAIEHRTRFFCLRVLLVASVTIPSGRLFGKILVRDNTLIFTSARGTSDARRGKSADIGLKKVVAFENRLEMELENWIEGSPRETLMLISNLRRQVVQGLRFAVSRNKDLAGILSFFCTMQEHAAEVPLVCKTYFVGVDSSGKILGRTNGNFYYIEVHDELPYAILKEHTCCDSPELSYLVRMDGQEVCSIPDHRDPAWRSKSTVKCVDPETKREISVTLTNGETEHEKAR